MILKICICEDDKAQRDYLSEIINIWAKKVGRDIKLYLFDSAEKYLFEMEEEKVDVLFLDIQMGNLNGMDLARKIRINNEYTKIVFITGIKDYVYEGYEVNAFRYIIKPYDEKIVIDILESLVEILRTDESVYYTFKINNQTIKLSQDEIVYINVEGHYINLFTKKEKYVWKQSLKNIKNELEFMVMANRSQLVNIKYVSSITRECCIVDNIMVQISRNCYNNINQKFIEYNKNSFIFEDK